jgi:hypothetical protein
MLLQVKQKPLRGKRLDRRSWHLVYRKFKTADF